MSFTLSRTPVKVPAVLTEHREIRTSLPAPGTESILQILEAYESRSMQGQLPLLWDRALNYNIYDHLGNKWIDFTSSIFVANVGHANPRVIAAIQEALTKPLLHTYAYPNKLRASYLKQLVSFAGEPFEKGFLLSAGTEATEATLKLMRMYGYKKGKRHPGVICIEGNWHGRTMGAQMMASKPEQKTWIGYQDPNIHHIPFPYPWLPEAADGKEFLKTALKRIEQRGIDLCKDICGFMLETFQGWGAVFYPENFVQEIESFCRDNDILLAFDEMQSGFARTGKRFGYEHYQITPDLICCGKGMGSGLPLSGVLGRAKIMDLPDVGNMSSTHSGNPLACAAGIATLNEIEALNLISESVRKGVYLHTRLQEMKSKFPDRVFAVLGKGMIAALLFRNPDTQEADKIFATRVVERCFQKGLLTVYTGRESLKIGPPLTINDGALAEGLDVLEEAIGEIACQSL